MKVEKKVSRTPLILGSDRGSKMDVQDLHAPIQLDFYKWSSEALQPLEYDPCYELCSSEDNTTDISSSESLEVRNILPSKGYLHRFKPDISTQNIRFGYSRRTIWQYYQIHLLLRPTTTLKSLVQLPCIILTQVPPLITILSHILPTTFEDYSPWIRLSVVPPPTSLSQTNMKYNNPSSLKWKGSADRNGFSGGGHKTDTHRLHFGRGRQRV